VLRFHSACPWRNNGKVEFVAAMIVAFTSIAGDEIMGIHRIRLDQPKRWPKADRMMLGRVTGSAAKLDPIGNCLVIGEGVETCIAARQLGLRPIWALGSASGIANFLPVGGVEELVILGENDNGTNRSAALKCRQTWKECRVTIVNPRRAKDMNDFVMEKENVGSAISLAVQRR
jgi:putative DNA primase/helicase